MKRLKNDVQARAVRTTLVHQRAHRHIPSVVHFARVFFQRDAHIAKEQLAEFRLTSHLTQRTNFNAGGFHVHEENGQSLCLATLASCGTTSSHQLPNEP